MTVDISLTGAIVLTIVGIIFCGFGLWMRDEVQKFRRRGQKVTGIVTDVEFVKSDDTNGVSGSYRPTLDVTGPDGTIVSCRTMFSSSGYDYAIGQDVDVLYIPGRDTVLVANGAARWVMPAAFLVMGGGALIAGLLALTGVTLPFGG
ncbi:DUF3592 domain-containing protein [Jannaschia pohangensis]|uniref:DUF3592 domain-containing protein n=1 Tax=Jannaschia pohangensis TaxID=390807 RepID=A0A1I3UYF7_9RHOB|nr:DUF3592 domain-containing protein [Jannaschia pohangensis]SFJ88258.1 Protein of unknown function [Jannaschia pohangensis]